MRSISDNSPLNPLNIESQQESDMRLGNKKESPSPEELKLEKMVSAQSYREIV